MFRTADGQSPDTAPPKSRQRPWPIRTPGRASGTGRGGLVTRPDHPMLGVGLMIGFCITAPLLDVAAKLASAQISVGQITAARFVIQAAIMLPVCLVLRQSLRPERQDIGLISLRALLLLAATFFFVGAIRVMPLADALAIVFVEPFLILLMGKFFLGETIGARRIGAAIVGFAGVLMVIQPSFEAFGTVALLPLGTAVTFASYMLVTRKLSARMDPVAMQYQTAVFGGAMAVVILAASYPSNAPSLQVTMPQGIYWLWLFGVGAFASLSHMLITMALRFAPSATLAPLHYTELISAGIFGYLVFGDFPNTLALTGIAVILLAGLYVIHRERITARAQVTAQPPEPI